ncbi:MAG: class I SAM-dependent methyltransferase [Candidatus Omnitrophica bacterium]|nr:class I SAM-dependent methyltransferase [Candidatus Omnitrophota bacterium]
MDNLVRQDQDRLKLFKRYGYDIPRGRRLIIAKARVSKGRILEVGTGKGHMTVELAKKGLRIVTIDLDRKAQKIARGNLKRLKLDKTVSLRIMDAEKLQYQDNSFEYVVSVNFIHHAGNPIKCLNEMVRVLKNKLIIADLNRRGERIMEKVHALDGRHHPVSKMSLLDVRGYLKRKRLVVKVYRDVCQTIIIAKKGAAR